MKTIYSNLLMITCIALIAMTFMQCGGKQSNEEGQYIWTPITGSYSDDSRAIDTLVMDNNWSDTAYWHISNAIESDFYNQKIEREDVITLYQTMLDVSSDFSFRKVDSLLQLHSVDEKELRKYREMNKFLSEEYKAKGKIDSTIREYGNKLSDSKDMIKAYDTVKKLCDSDFKQEVNSYPPYDRYKRTAEDQENRIKRNRYWNSHFKNNNSFNRLIKQFPNHIETAKPEYYTNTIEHFSKNYLILDGVYSLHENIGFYTDLVFKINKDLGVSSKQTKDLTQRIVAYYKNVCKNNPSITIEEKTKEGNILSDTILKLVNKDDDYGVASFIMTEL